MAFPLPSHLPRKGRPEGTSSKIIYKLDDASMRTLNAQLASSWLAELDNAIHLSKARIHERIERDSLAFNQQLRSATSVQSKVHTLTTSADALDEALSNSQTGLVPTLVNRLSAHSGLAQALADADVIFECLAHLQRCRSTFQSLESSVDFGELPDAVATGRELEELLSNAPTVLTKASVMTDLKGRLRAMKNRIEELLNEACSRTIVISPSEIVIRPSVQVHQSEVVLPATAIYSSLSAASLSSLLATIRRDLMIHYIEPLLQRPSSIKTESCKDDAGLPESRLRLSPSPAGSELLTNRLRNLTIVLEFLSANLFPNIPSSHRDGLRKLLCKPITTALQTHLIIPFIPSSFAALPKFLDLVERSVRFEHGVILGTLENSPSDLPIKEWADGLSGHYERKRRIDVMEDARMIITRQEEVPARTFRAESDVQPEVETVVTRIVQENQTRADEADAETGESGWGFEDEVEPESQLDDDSASKATEDLAEAWGWAEDESTTVDDEAAWDDPWNEPSDSSPTSMPPDLTATRTGDLAPNGQQRQANGQHHRGRSTSNVELPPSTSAKEITRPKDVSPPVLKETYLVSERTKDVIALVKRIIDEGKELSASGLFPSTSESKAAPGARLLQAALVPLELFRALYPVTFQSEIASCPERAMRFSNDCIYLSNELEKIRKQNADLTGMGDKFLECQVALKVWGDSCSKECVEKWQHSVDAILDVAEGFTGTAEQDRYDECEEAVNQALKEVRAVAAKWKLVLTKSKYYGAIGSVAGAAISRVMGDILALPDITEVESHRLAEMCRILNSLEGLFVEDHEQPSFIVAYVPGWLKFSYLTELLEASIADISYLFEEGALVDFDVNELATLVRALFADTPLRATTINKLMSGHPMRDQQGHQ